MDPAHRLLGVLHPHGDVPPIQNAGDRLADRGADKTRKRCFTVAEDRDGATGLPSQGLRMKFCWVVDGLGSGVIRGVSLKLRDLHVGEKVGGRILGSG